MKMRSRDVEWWSDDFIIAGHWCDSGCLSDKPVVRWRLPWTALVNLMALLRDMLGSHWLPADLVLTECLCTIIQVTPLKLSATMSFLIRIVHVK